jgi:ribonuclease P protein component
VLAAPHRLRRPADFTSVLRRGVRSGRATLVLHLLLPDGDAGAEPHPDAVPALTPARVGFVVPKTVGGSVIRHRVTRQLRALCAARIDTFPTGSSTVVRALPPAAGATSAQLGADVDAALERAVRRARRVPAQPAGLSGMSGPSR